MREGLQNSQCVDTQKDFAGKLRPFLRDRVGREVIFIKYLLMPASRYF